MFRVARRRTMQSIPMLLAVVGVILAAGTIGAARAENDGDQRPVPTVTLFTPPLDGDHLNCTAANVSSKTIGIVITLVGVDGSALCDEMGTPPQCNPGFQNPETFLDVPPGTIVAIGLLHRNPSEDGYCRFALVGTHTPRDVRVEIAVSKITSSGVLVVRQLAGH